MAKQVIYRRGTTAEHANFVGANGEITVDTVKHVVIVHDGVTPGGWPVANTSSITSSINTLTANAANQASAITVLQANAATQANLLTSLISNASVQQASIDAFIVTSNATAIFANIAGVQANVTAANVQIGLLVGNATVQSEAIVLANANIIALQSGLTAANVTIASFVASTGFANLEQLTANITAVNSAISTQSTTFATNVAVAGIRANVTAANVAISALQANIAAANVAINNIALSPSLIASVKTAVNYVTEVAIGAATASQPQGQYAVAVGYNSGNEYQGEGAIAIGAGTGTSHQGDYAVAIGSGAGQLNQKTNAVAIGRYAGSQGQGFYSVAIGWAAGTAFQPDNTIMLNATGTSMGSTQANSFQVAPIRNDTVNVSNVLSYNTTTQEITYARNSWNLLQTFSMSFVLGANTMATTYTVANLTSSYNEVIVRCSMNGIFHTHIPTIALGTNQTYTIGTAPSAGGLHTIRWNSDNIIVAPGDNAQSGTVQLYAR